ncbi:MAG: Metal-dependent phosphohydrolase, subdomain [Proteobacteria bacterium]|nr:Metal-dependent phosphohydrolase, subdomain [Pseudomonadota bacterium]
MTSQITFKILEDIARDLSSNEVSFPTFLDITFQVRTALKNPNLTVDQLAKLVGAEPMMSARIIRMANSVAMNPSGREIADVKNGIIRVGMEAVRTVSFAVAMSQLRNSTDMAPFEHISKKLWEHSAHVASMARVLAKKIARINGDEAMFAGLVHDLGVFYLMSRAAPYPELVQNEAELHALLASWHDNIGHALLSAMGQPETILTAVQEHEVDRELTEIKTLSDVLYIANKMANRSCPWRDPELDGAIDTSILDTIFDADTLDEITTESEEEVQSLKVALGG